METISKETKLGMLNKCIFSVIGKLAILVTLIVYVLTGNVVDATRTFVVLSLFDGIRQTLCLWFPIAILGWAEIIVCLQGIQKFLMLEERHELVFTGFRSSDTEYLKHNHVYGISMKKFCAKWKAGDEYSLEDVNLKVEQQQLVAIVGPVGSGKSTLLYAVLKELPPVYGKLNQNGSIAYAGQDPWLFAGTIRENILFGLGLNPIWYAQVLDACALNMDLAGFPYGDNTLVHDSGVYLSGGIKARVNLARAVYSSAQIYLLDEPLSAVDIKTGRHIFEKCISGLLKEKAVLLVTHQLQYLEAAHEILVLSKGRVENRGTLTELTSRGQLGHVLSKGDLPPNPFEIDDGNYTFISEPEPIQPSVLEHSNASSETSLIIEKKMKPRYGTFVAKQRQEKEEMLKGLASIGFYWHYFRSGNGFILLFALAITLVFCQFLFNGSDYWLEIWTSAEAERSRFESKTTGQHDMDYMWVYCGIIGLLFVVCMARFQFMAQTFTNTSIALHKSMLNAVIRAPMRFIEINSAGRVFNRFSYDVGILDETLTQSISNTVGLWLEILGAQIIIAITSPLTAIPGVALLLITYGLIKGYLRTGSSLKRLEAVRRSPLFGHITTSLNGMPTIRGFERTDAFERRYHVLQDIHSSVTYLSFAASRWLSISVDWFTNVYFVCVVFGFFFIEADSAIVGLAISTALSMTASISWSGNRLTDLDNTLVSVRRILDYTRVAPEAPLESPEKRPPSFWPETGEIQFQDICVQEGNKDPVLRNINCTVRGGEKIGIIGLKDSGKSSLISALFRIVEPSSGYIYIDGTNVLELGLHDLRSKIAIIPKNPSLFQGTIRRNLDPVGQYSDTLLWICLDQVHLGDRVRGSSENGLDTVISEGGSNFSHGEKQLIYLARSLLTKPKIIVLDEVTSNIDSETDILVQRVLAEHFGTSTILTIAHRLDSFMKSDRILVLDNGSILEYDEPYVLLEKKGRLYEMVERTGASGSMHLILMAKQAHEERLRTSSRIVSRKFKDNV